MANGKQELTTAQMADYIHQAVEIEKDIYTLSQMEEQFKKESEELRASEKIVDPPRLRKFVEEPYVRKSFIKNFFKTIWADGEGLFFIIPIIALIFIIPFTIINSLVMAILQMEFSSSWKISSAILIVVVILIIIISTYIERRNIKINRKENEDEKNKVERENSEKMNQYYKEKSIAEEKFQLACLKADTFEKQIELIRQHREKLESLRSQLYSSDIIPVDYRTIDCVYCLEYIFKNHLADTMREAILQYEDRVFKGQIVKGMSTIISQLQSLRGQMAYIANDIHTINMNVKTMSQNILELVDIQCKTQSTFDNILGESKATRYAVEAVQKHNDEIRRYL